MNSTKKFPRVENLQRLSLTKIKKKKKKKKTFWRPKVGWKLTAYIITKNADFTS